jgi:hypothetical protein
MEMNARNSTLARKLASTLRSHSFSATHQAQHTEPGRAVPLRVRLRGQLDPSVHGVALHPPHEEHGGCAQQGLAAGVTVMCDDDAIRWHRRERSAARQRATQLVRELESSEHRLAFSITIGVSAALAGADGVHRLNERVEVSGVARRSGGLPRRR